MNESSKADPQSGGDISAVAYTAMSTALDIVTGLPEPIREGFFQAAKRLTLAAVEIPAAWLEGRAAEVRAGSEARIANIQAVSKHMAAKMDVPAAYVFAAQEKALQRVVGKQKNLDAVVEVAAKDLVRLSNVNSQPETVASLHQDTSTSRLSEDWLNSFEEEAAKMSTTEMQLLFGKILAGEINRPGSFSRRTLNLMSHLDNVAAKLFLDLCSMAVAMVSTQGRFDVRVLSLGRDAAANGLSGFGLSFTQLNILQEYGLIISDLNSWNLLAAVMVRDNEYTATLEYLGNHYALSHTKSPEAGASLRVHGVRLSAAGQELFQIVEPLENKNYTEALFAYLSGLGFVAHSVPNPLNHTST